MTPKRQRWWRSLSTSEKKLRELLKTYRRILKLNKGCLMDFKDSIYFAEEVLKQKLIINALKHELNSTTVAMYVGRLEEGPIYQCKKCGGAFKDSEQSYCCWCGRKIKEWKK